MSAILDHTMMRVEDHEEGIGWDTHKLVSRDPESCGDRGAFTRDRDGREIETVERSE